MSRKPRQFLVFFLLVVLSGQLSGSVVLTGHMPGQGMEAGHVVAVMQQGRGSGSSHLSAHDFAAADGSRGPIFEQIHPSAEHQDCEVLCVNCVNHCSTFSVGHGFILHLLIRELGDAGVAGVASDIVTFLFKPPITV